MPEGELLPGLSFLMRFSFSPFLFLILSIYSVMYDFIFSFFFFGETQSVNKVDSKERLYLI